MVLKKIGVAVASLALLMSGPASASSVAAASASTAVAMQDSEDTDSAFERNLPLIVAVGFPGAFACLPFVALGRRGQEEPRNSPCWHAISLDWKVVE